MTSSIKENDNIHDIHAFDWSILPLWPQDRHNVGTWICKSYDQKFTYFIIIKSVAKLYDLNKVLSLLVNRFSLTVNKLGYISIYLVNREDFFFGLKFLSTIKSKGHSIFFSWLNITFCCDPTNVTFFGHVLMDFFISLNCLLTLMLHNFEISMMIPTLS